MRISDRGLSVFRRCCCCHCYCPKLFMFLAHLSWKLKWAFLIAFHPSSVCLFPIFDFFSRTTGPISTKLGTKHPWVNGIQFCSKKNHLILIQIIMVFFLSSPTLWYTHVFIDLNCFLGWAMWPMGLLLSLLMNDCANFNQICKKAVLDKGMSMFFFLMKGSLFFKER